jgi:hypothetical protein
MANNRVSSNAITGVAPVTIYSDSPDALHLDASKYRVVGNKLRSRWGSSNLLDSDEIYDYEADKYNEPEYGDAPSIYSIIIEKNELYLDTSGKSRARLVFKVTNIDTDKISDVDIRVSQPTSESGVS